MEKQSVDVLVCGGGMSGMACAAFVAESGAKVLVIEKQGQLGGSANYSAGMFWGPKDYESLRSWVPNGDPKLQRAWMNDYLRAVQWVRESGVPTAERFSPIMTIGIGYPIEIPRLYDVHRRRIECSGTGSCIMLNTDVVRLIQQEQNVTGSRIVGAVIRSRNGNSERLIEVQAKQVVLATGGFQGSSELKSIHFGPGCDDLFVRSNVGSVGDGLKLATSAGAGTSGGMSTFYGHLLAAPLRREQVDPADFKTLAAYHSRRCLLINQSGQRFSDETEGDEVVNQYLARQKDGKGFLLFNDDTRRNYCLNPLFPNAGAVDRLEKARSYGCNVVESPSLHGLLDKLKDYEVDVQRAKATVESFRRAVQSKDTVQLDFPTGKGGEPPAPLIEGEGPFFAMEVQPSVTFTYGGILIDEQGHAMTQDRRPIPGLLVAGVDGGGFSNLGYAGGLALAFVTGYWAARTATSELGRQVTKLPPVASQDKDSISRSRI